MTTQRSIPAQQQPASGLASGLNVDDPVGAAHAYVADRALTPSPVGQVGLELELHLVDRADPQRRPSWAEVTALTTALPPMPSGSRVTLEPGGQIELSTPPAADVVAAVAALRADAVLMRRHLREAGYAAVALGTDPARPPHRVNPHPRYAAMERHFDAIGCAGAGRSMMTATAALQVNLDAGPRAGWQQRVDLVRSLVPVLVALSSTSPWLGGRTSGWHSMRQGIWHGIDHGRSDPVERGEPTAAWADYALSAPVMLVQADEVVPVTERVSFRDWLMTDHFGRPPTLADLDYHLTTLFPPLRPRGYLEIRCLDALPDRWWPAVAAITATLVDDPAAADAATEAAARVSHLWASATRAGPADADVRRAVLTCLESAVRHCPAGLRPEVEAFAELFERGSSPSEELRHRIETVGPHAVLLEETDD